MPLRSPSREMFVLSTRAPPSRDGRRPANVAKTSIPPVTSSGSRLVVRLTIDSDSLENVSPVLYDRVSTDGVENSGHDLPHAFLHIAAKDHVPIRLRPGYDIRLVIFPVAHDIFGNLWCSCKKDLSSCAVALRILNTFEVTRSVTGAVEHNFRRWIRKCRVDI
jgi:hypothetical protein